MGVRHCNLGEIILPDGEDQDEAPDPWRMLVFEGCPCQLFLTDAVGRVVGVTRPLEAPLPEPEES